MNQPDEVHAILLEAVKENRILLEAMRRDISKDLDKCKSDMIKLRYYIYTLAVLVLVLLGKPELITALL